MQTLSSAPDPATSIAVTILAILLALTGFGADDKVCINFAKFVNNLCISSYTITK